MPNYKKDSSSSLNPFTNHYNNTMYANATGFESINSTNGTFGDNSAAYEARDQLFVKEDLHSLSDIIFTSPTSQFAPQQLKRLPSKVDVIQEHSMYDTTDLFLQKDTGIGRMSSNTNAHHQ